MQRRSSSLRIRGGILVSSKMTRKGPDNAEHLWDKISANAYPLTNISRKEYLWVVLYS